MANKSLWEPNEHEIESCSSSTPAYRTLADDALYAKGLEELGRWLTYEALRDWLPHRKEEVMTLHGKSVGEVIESNVPLLALPNIPGGFEMWYGGRNVLFNANLCIGGVPSSIEENSGVIIYMDQITDGVDLLETLMCLNKQNVEPRRIRVISALAAKPGLQKLGEIVPDLNIYCACIDADISDNKNINPGIGNPFLRLNTKSAGLN